MKDVLKYMDNRLKIFVFKIMGIKQNSKIIQKKIQQTN